MTFQAIIKGTFMALTGVGGLTLGSLGLLQGWHAMQANRLWRSMKTQPSTKHFEPAMVEDLPAPAQRYLLHAIQPNARLASSVEVTMHGAYTHSADIKAPKYPFRGKRIIRAGKGFVFKVVVPGSGLQRLHETGLAYYANQKGYERAKYLNLIPIYFRLSDPVDITRTFLERYITDLVLLPSALLPQPGVEWQAIDDQHAKVKITQDGQAMSLTLTIGPAGELQEVCFDYWSAKGGAKTYQAIPCGMQIHQEQRFGDYTIPSSFNFIWWYNLPDREPGTIFEFELDSARFR
ncbi:DUF6544 family protein [Herpetosiphon sp. NSE202]|uniref:DUF6544 family protein n=1 Tax=Herpetosiphon sp. NSE202 TaxID=3351349 RepID=UPI00362877CC